MTLTHGSLFTGVGGMDLGFDAAGIDTLWQCELNAQCRSVLARRWPKVKRYVDVKQVNGAEVAPVDVLTFGSPCQDLSVAGKRTGLNGERSGLYFEAVRVIKEMREATNGEYPKYAVWENVRGALSSNGGADFTAALQALADVGAVDIGWRVVSTAQFGPPQRRLRVFVVASFGAEHAGQVLAYPTRVCWHFDQGAEARQEATGEAAQSAGSSGWHTERLTTTALTIAGLRDTAEACAGRLVYAPVATTALTTKCGNTQDDTQVPQLLAYGEQTQDAPASRTVAHWEGLNQVLSDATPHHAIRTNLDSGDCVLQPDPEDTAKYMVRRLTPRECERLQGWPDDHTRYSDTGKELSDTARYKMVGNGVSAPVAQWLAENIAAVESGTDPGANAAV